MKSHKINKLIVMMMAVVMVLSALIPSTPLKAQTTGSIQLNYAEIEGVTFDLYRVGKMDGHDGYDLSKEFANSGVDLFDKTAAETLKGYVASENISPMATSKTDAQGHVSFKNLEEGAYLLLGSTAKVGEVTYTAKPVLLSIPSEVLGEIKWDMVVDGKFSSDEEEIKNYYKSISAQKVWEDEDNKYQKRPSEITIQLLENGEVKSTKTLSAENNWSYTWSKDEFKLSKSSEWTIVEKNVDKNYTVKVERAESGERVVSFVCTNTYKPEGDSTTTSKKPTSSGGGGGKKSSSLPQTGQLWWPVLLLLCGGLLCMIFGVLLTRKNR